MKALILLAVALLTLSAPAHSRMKKCLIDGKIIYSDKLDACPGEEKSISSGTVSGIDIDTSNAQEIHARSIESEITKQKISRNESSSNRKIHIKSLKH